MLKIKETPLLKTQNKTIFRGSMPRDAPCKKCLRRSIVNRASGQAVYIRNPSIQNGWLRPCNQRISLGLSTDKEKNEVQKCRRLQFINDDKNIFDSLQEYHSKMQSTITSPCKSFVLSAFEIKADCNYSY